MYVWWLVLGFEEFRVWKSFGYEEFEEFKSSRFKGSIAARSKVSGFKGSIAARSKVQRFNALRSKVQGSSLRVQSSNV